MFRYIYRYRNKLNGKVYIGQTIDIERRKSEHLKDAERGTGFVFHRALSKYGIDCFDFDVLHVVEGDERLTQSESAVEHPSELISTLSLKERVDFAVGDALEYLEDKISLFKKYIFTKWFT